MLRIDIAQYASRVTRDDGAHLRHAIEQAWHDAGPIVLDFQGLTIASVSFFDEALGVLALEHPVEELTRRVRVENMVAADRELLNNIVSSRRRERDDQLGAAEAL